MTYIHVIKLYHCHMSILTSEHRQLQCVVNYLDEMLVLVTFVFHTVYCMKEFVNCNVQEWLCFTTSWQKFLKS